MSFYTDRQTISDLDIFGYFKDDISVFNLFNKTELFRSREVLEQMLRNPLTDTKEINERSGLISFLTVNRIGHDLNRDDLDFIEHYLQLPDAPHSVSKVRTTFRCLSELVNPRNEYYLIKRGVVLIIENIRKFYSFMSCLSSGNNTLLLSYVKELGMILKTPGLSRLTLSGPQKKTTPFVISRYDYIFRYVAKDKIRRILQIMYEMDVFVAAARVAGTGKFGFARAGNTGNCISIKNLVHPFLNNPVGNDIELDDSRNILLVTGANMAGKSTFMKAFGIAVYLAHTGFPVPAGDMHFTVQDGLVSTINLSDDLGLGYSHFYAEVKRLKNVVEQLNRTPRIVILFDELFRGTNVKDACEATVTILGALARRKAGFIMTSTHIMEAVTALRHTESNMMFLCFRTEIRDDGFKYSYKLQDGISDDRLGMDVIRKEGILDLIDRKPV